MFCAQERRGRRRRRRRPPSRRADRVERRHVGRARAPATASPAQTGSSSIRQRVELRTSSRPTWATSAPIRGTISTRPSAREDPQRLAHRRAADAGELWRASARSSRAPGASSPAMIRCASQSATARESSLCSAGRPVAVGGREGGIGRSQWLDPAAAVCCIQTFPLSPSSPEGDTVTVRKSSLFVAARRHGSARQHGRVALGAGHARTDADHAEARRLDHDRPHRGLAVVRQDERLPERVDLAHRADQRDALHGRQRRQDARCRGSRRATRSRRTARRTRSSSARASSSRTASR